MSGFTCILWQEYVIFQRNFFNITISSLIAPILYLIAFGWGVGRDITVYGTSYMTFVISGIIALTTMTASFSAVGNSINISRLYEKTFEEFMIAPINMLVYTAGKVTAGALRGCYAGFLIIMLALAFKTGIKLNGYFFLIMVLNCFVFAAIGFTAGIFIKSHADMAKFTSYIITPMAFLCGTFFPVEKMPGIVKNFIFLLPLTHTSLGLRKSSFGEGIILHMAVLLVYFSVTFVIAVYYCKKTE
jgi:ABC-type multidrug transport system permease subunit